MSDERINMTADEFFDHWHDWCLMPVTIHEADVLNQVFANIMTTFEERGSMTHNRAIFAPGAKGFLFESPDSRKAAD